MKLPWVRRSQVEALLWVQSRAASAEADRQGFQGSPDQWWEGYAAGWADAHQEIRKMR